jgi:hypothetical protein
MYPKTIDEWEMYVGSLTADELWNKAMAMNSIVFIRKLEEEGSSAEEINKIFGVFLKRFVAIGLEPPTGGYVDFSAV